MLHFIVFRAGWHLLRIALKVGRVAWCLLVSWHRWNTAGKTLRLYKEPEKVCDCKVCSRCGWEKDCFWHSPHAYER